MPLTAALTLDASATEMGVLAAAGSLPPLVAGPLAGVWADRARRRPLLVAADLGRAALLATVPAAALTVGLRIELLWVVAFLAGLLTIVFDVAHASLVPSLVRREELVAGNSRLEISRSGALVAGPGLAGLLVQLLSAPVAILADALSFLASALLVARIRTPENPPAPTSTRRSIWSEARDGLRTVLRDPLLSPMATSLCLFNFFYGLIGAVYVLFATRALGLSPAALGLVYAVGSASFPVAAAASGWAGRSSGAPASAMPLFCCCRLRQAVTPSALLGRVNGAMLTIGLGAAPLGALLGGLLGDAIGLRPALLVGALGIQLGFVRLLRSPLRSLRVAPVPPPDPSAAA